MTQEISEIKLHPLTIYGIQDGKMIPLTDFKMIDPSLRTETIEELMSSLATNEIVILGGTLIRTERFDCFKVM